MFNRLDGCTLQALNDALYHKKTLLQAWSYRGIPAAAYTKLPGRRCISGVLTQPFYILHRDTGVKKFFAGYGCFLSF